MIPGPFIKMPTGRTDNKGKLTKSRFSGIVQVVQVMQVMHASRAVLRLCRFYPSPYTFFPTPQLAGQGVVLVLPHTHTPSSTIPQHFFDN
jgi:hypothetical protein